MGDRVRTILEYARERRRERRAWSQATTLADAGKLIVRWLDGEFERWPGHLGPPDAETTLITPTLRNVNLVGYVTTCSQPGDVDPRGRWRQRAAVNGYVDVENTRLLDLITEEVERCADLRLLVYAGMSQRRDYSDSIDVTQERLLPFGPWLGYTDFGCHLPRSDVELNFSGCRRQLVDVACDAYQVTIVDMTWNANGTLWPMLERVVARYRTGE